MHIHIHLDIIMNPFALSCVITAAITTFLAFFVYLRNTKAPLNKIWGLLSLAIDVWIISEAKLSVSSSAPEALFWDRALYVGSVFIAQLFLHFVLIFLNIYKEKKNILYIWYVFSFVFLILNFTFLFREGMIFTKPLGINYLPKIGSLYFLFPIVFIGCVGYSFYLMLHMYRFVSGSKRNQIKYLFLGAIIGFAGGVTNFLPPLGIKISPVGNYFMAFYTFIISYAIVKHQLMDIRVAITRGAIFIMVYGAVLAFSLFLGYWLKSWLVSSIITVAIAMFAPFIYTNMRLAIERRFFYQEKIKLVQEEQLRRQKTIDTFSGSMAHEIANPIHVIVGLIDMVKIKTLGDLKDNIPEKDRAYLEERFKTISEGAFRIAGMVKTIREFSSQTTGTFKPVALKEVIKNVLTMLSGKLKEETINLEVSLVDDITVIGNKIALEETILNILLNSIEAFANCETTDKEIIITASLQPNNKALVTISDNACGIPENMLNDIFLDFVTTKPSSSNLGMGLSLCRKIIALHKGKIWAQSPGENKGADIFIELPINGLV